MSTIPIGELTDSSLIIAIALMFIGGASGSTGGGIKVTTFAILLFTIISTVRGRSFTEAFGRRVTAEVIARALSVALLAVAIVFVGALVLEVTGAQGTFIQIAFETVSAFGTVGHSTGITPASPTRRCSSSSSPCSSGGSGRSPSSSPSRRARSRSRTGPPSRRSASAERPEGDA